MFNHQGMKAKLRVLSMYCKVYVSIALIYYRIENKTISSSIDESILIICSE